MIYFLVGVFVGYWIHKLCLVVLVQMGELLILRRKS